MGRRPAASSGRLSRSVLDLRQLCSGLTRSEQGWGGLALLAATAKRSGGSVPMAAAGADYVQFDSACARVSVQAAHALSSSFPWEVEGSARINSSAVPLDMRQALLPQMLLTAVALLPP